MSYAATLVEGLKPNYYALAISIIKGYTIEKSLSCMGIRSYSYIPVERKKSYKEICIPCAVIKTVTGMSYRKIGRLMDVNYETVQHAILYYKENYCDKRSVN